ncbi:MAG: class I SAM-dependent methyltransferase [Methanoregula sp.]|nr:class I SAM-dependent methyltransferase [Methanoregula sp.]
MQPADIVTKIHYDRFLAEYYPWMAGGFEENTARNSRFFLAYHIRPASRAVAIDLGAGSGFQAIPLAEAGFRVTAVDFCQPLLDELRFRAPSAGVETISGDIMNFPLWTGRRPELITCMGDTLTHLPDRDAVQSLIRQCHAELIPGGKFVLSLRDYSADPVGSVVIVPVQRDGDRIFLCRLEYRPDHVLVTDIVYSRRLGQWERSASNYVKLRLAPAQVREMMKQAGFRIEFMAPENGLVAFIGINENV